MSKEGSLTREEEERLLFMSFLPSALLMIGTMFYLMWLMTDGTMEFDFAIVRNIILLVLPFFTTLATFIYEILSSFKTKRTFLFRLKRFSCRAAFAFVSALLLVSFLTLFEFLLGSVLPIGHLVILALLCMVLVLVALAFNPKTRQFIQKLTGENGDYGSRINKHSWVESGG